VITMVIGIPLTALTVNNKGGNGALGLVWLCLVLINVAYVWHSRPRGDR